MESSESHGQSLFTLLQLVCSLLQGHKSLGPSHFQILQCLLVLLPLLLSLPTGRGNQRMSLSQQRPPHGTHQQRQHGHQ
jgi:hypothetical protein